ncbi:MAG TPA: DASS family sodium-coupled anion symporter [Nocardioidaceae bacterium]|nr:DASS family sodium-coupled anion symporter [Nocardioidaceae bacterium]
MASDFSRGKTYRTLDEQKERLTPAEERFERGRRTIGLFAGPAAFLVMLVLPLDLTWPQQALAAIMVLTITYWLSEAIPIPVTAVVAMALCVILGVAPVDDVFAAFGSSTLFVFMGAFIIAEAMTTHGLDRRFAFRVLSIPGAARSTYGVIVAFGAVSLIVSAFISNTATAAMLLPIGLGMMTALAGPILEKSGETDPTRLRFGTALMLMIAYGASVGGLITPIGSPPNLIGIGFIEEQTDTTISFFQWTVTALPIVLVMFVALCFVLILLNRPEVNKLPGAVDYIAKERAKLGPMSRGGRNTLVVFVLAVGLWVLPGVVGLVAGNDSDLYLSVVERLDEGVVAILAAALLFMLPVNWAERKFTLNWNQAVNIDWGTILLFGGGIVLGTLLSDTGLAETLGQGMVERLGVTSLLAITTISVVIAVLISETTSNTASAAVVIPIVIPIAIAAGVDPVVPALAATFGASYGFMLPVSTPPNAIVYGSGLVPITKMVRSGVVFDIIGIILVVIGVSLMANLVGLA